MNLIPCFSRRAEPAYIPLNHPPRSKGNWLQTTLKVIAIALVSLPLGSSTSEEPLPKIQEFLPPVPFKSLTPNDGTLKYLSTLRIDTDFRTALAMSLKGDRVGAIELLRNTTQTLPDGGNLDDKIISTYAYELYTLAEKADRTEFLSNITGLIDS